MAITHIVWDWNGTLFDDLHCCVGVANQLLAEYGLPSLNGVADYHAKFRFPIIDYYADLGFDVSPGGDFESASVRYHQLYRAAAHDCRLHRGASDVLATLHRAGIVQVLISASEQSNLERQLSPFRLHRWLAAAHGLDDIYARSKEHLVRRWLAEAGVAPSQVMMIGDSQHDFEIADAVGARCVLFAGGHHAAEHLASLGTTVVTSLTDVPPLVLSGLRADRC